MQALEEQRLISKYREQFEAEIIKLVPLTKYIESEIVLYKKLELREHSNWVYKKVSATWAMFDLTLHLKPLSMSRMWNSTKS